MEKIELGFRGCWERGGGGETIGESGTAVPGLTGEERKANLWIEGMGLPEHTGASQSTQQLNASVCGKWQ